MNAKEGFKNEKCYCGRNNPSKLKGWEKCMKEKHQSNEANYWCIKWKKGGLNLK
jgi:hypothetical protein